MRDDRLTEAITQSFQQIIEDAGPELRELAEYASEELSGIYQIIEEDKQLDLTELEEHILTSTLRESLQDLLDVENYALLAATVIEFFFSLSDGSIDEGGAEELLDRDQCELCERKMPLTAHHLIPRSLHTSLAKRGFFTLDEMRTRVAMICRPCHTQIHRLFDHKILALHHNTIEKLVESEEVTKWVRYARAQRGSHLKAAKLGLRYRR